MSAKVVKRFKKQTTIADFFIKQAYYQIVKSYKAKRRRVVERSEKSRVHQEDVYEILRFALDVKMQGNLYFDIAPSTFIA